MPVSWFEHDGHRVLLVDFSDLDDAEAMTTLRQARAEARSQPGPSLLLLDLTRCRLGTGFMRLARMSEPLDSQFVRKRAAVGAEGVNRVLVTGYNLLAGDKQVVPCASRAEALAYLTEP